MAKGSGRGRAWLFLIGAVLALAWVLSGVEDPADDMSPDERAALMRKAAGLTLIDLATRTVLPAVAQRKPRSDGAALAGGIAVVALLGAATFWSLNASRSEQSGPAQNQPEQAPAVPPQAITVPQPAAPAAAPGPQAAPAPQPVLAAPPQTAIATAPRANPASSPTVVFDASALPVPLAPGVPVTPGGNGNDDFAARIGGVGGAKAVATANIDPKTTVTQGTLIPAVLETAIDTDVPGYVRAVAILE